MGLLDLLKNAFESRALKYGYSNARVSGMKGLIIKPSVLEDLIRVKTIDEMVELLQRTHYKEDLISLSIRYKGSELIELALAAHFSKVIRKVLNFTPKSDKKYAAALLRRLDLLNLKTILNARKSRRSFEDIRPYLISSASLSGSDLERIHLSQSPIQEIRRTKLWGELFESKTNPVTKKILYSLKKELKNPGHQIQTILDLALYSLLESSFDSNKKEIRSFRNLFKKEVTAKNIAIIERLKSMGIQKSEIQKYTINIEGVQIQKLNKIMDSKSLEETLKLAKSNLSGIGASNTLNSLVDLEINLEKAIALEKLKIFYRSNLSIGAILGFLLIKEEEINNIRKIAKGKEYGLPDDKIRQTLVVA